MNTQAAPTPTRVTHRVVVPESPEAGFPAPTPRSPSIAQRVILGIGFLGGFFTSLVPPAAAGHCRFHVFLDSALPYSKHYGSVQPNLQALVSELALTIAVTGMAFMVAGLFARRSTS